MNEREEFLAAAKATGVVPEQMWNFLKARIYLQERQLVASAAARQCDGAEGPTAIAFGGARGGGKSHWLLAQMGADDCQRAPGLKCLLLRKVGKANLEHFEDLRRRLFGFLDHEFSAYRGILSFKNGSRIIAGHFQTEQDIDAYLGLEYDVIGIEEATTLSARKYSDISTCCRTSRPNWRPRIYSTANPGGIGHAWYRARFVTPYLNAECRMKSAERNGGLVWSPGQDTVFVPARVTDNRWNNPEYKRVLEALSGWQRRAWLDGDWDIAAGQYFTTFRREVHVISEFDESRAREWFCALDYGFTHYTVVLLGCTDGDGNVIVVDEHAERLWLPQRHAVAIKAMLARHRVPVESSELRARKSEVGGQRSEVGLEEMRVEIRNREAEIGGRSREAVDDGSESEGRATVLMGEGEAPRTRRLELRDLRRFVAGADVFSRQSDGRTIADQYIREGIRLRPASMDRVNGWAEILGKLGDPEASVPARLFLHQRCARLVETISAMQHDPSRPEDVLKVDADENGVGGDDAADCLRYLVASKPRVVYERRLTGL